MRNARRTITVTVPGWDSVFAVAAISFAFTVVAYVLFQGIPWAEISHDGNAAAWVQAIGSVFGILLAVAIPAWQHAVDTRRGIAAERAESIRQISIAAQMGGSALSLMLQIASRRRDVNLYESQRERCIQRGGLTDILRSVETIRIQDLPSPQASGAILGLLYSLRLSLTDVGEEVEGDLPGSQERANPWLQNISMIYEGTTELLRQLKGLGESFEYRDPNLLKKSVAMMKTDPEYFARADQLRREHLGVGFADDGHG